MFRKCPTNPQNNLNIRWTRTLWRASLDTWRWWNLPQYLTLQLLKTRCASKLPDVFYQLWSILYQRCVLQNWLFRVYYDLEAAIGFMPVEVNIIPIGKPIKEQKLQTVSTLMVSLTVNYPFFDDIPKGSFQKRFSGFCPLRGGGTPPVR